MEFPSTFNMLLTIFLSLPFLLLFSNVIKKHRNVRKLPQGPWKLPLIGNLHQLVGKLPHHILRDLAKKYGPLMNLQLGEVPVLVVTSPKFAKEILKNDLVFGGKPETLALKVLFYDREDLAAHPYDNYWKQMRKIFVQELVSAKKVKSFGPIRRGESDRLVESILNSNGELVNMSEKIRLYTSAVICGAAFGMVSIDQDKLIIQLIKEAAVLSSGFDIADTFPSYKFLHSLSCQMPKLLKIHSKIDGIIEDVIKQHVHKDTVKKGNGETEEEDLVDTLLRIKETSSLNIPVTIKNIKGIIMDVFAAGNESSSTTAIWAMTELMRNAQVMENAQTEIRQAFEGKESIDEVDLQKLEYLNLIIKETLRLHPAAPLIPPREAMKDCVIDGYHIPAKTRVFINAWAIGRDPEYWHDPETFIPERFKSSNVDFLGNNFEFLPFGAGKRICPGIAFALANIQVPLALLLFHFDWNLPKDMKPEDLDIIGAFGISCPPTKDLCLIPTLRRSKIR